MNSGAASNRSVSRISRSGESTWFSGLIGVFALMLSWLSLTSVALAIDVSDFKWGFDGKVAPHRFNVLSVLINNPTPQPFVGDLFLRKRLGGAGSVDATIVEPLTLAPNSARWVQF